MAYRTSCQEGFFVGAGGGTSSQPGDGVPPSAASISPVSGSSLTRSSPTRSLASQLSILCAGFPFAPSPTLDGLLGSTRLPSQALARADSTTLNLAWPSA